MRNRSEYLKNHCGESVGDWSECRATVEEAFVVPQVRDGGSSDHIAETPGEASGLERYFGNCLDLAVQCLQRMNLGHSVTLRYLSLCFLVDKMRIIPIVRDS